MILFHSTSRMLIGSPRVTGGLCNGFYLARTKRDSMTFGDITYKVDVKPVCTLIINDNEVKQYAFFNMSRAAFNEYIEAGYDSIQWNKCGLIKEFIVLDAAIVKSISIC